MFKKRSTNKLNKIKQKQTGTFKLFNTDKVCIRIPIN